MTTCPRCGKESAMPFHTCKTMTTKTARMIAQELMSGPGELEDSEATIESLVQLARAVHVWTHVHPLAKAEARITLNEALARVEKLVEI